MKIIDNKKDYYDYLQGVYGIDEKVVFDRRGSIVLANDYRTDYLVNKSNHIDENHVNEISPYKVFRSNAYNGYWYNNVGYFTYLMQVGKHCYIIEVQREVDEYQEFKSLTAKIIDEFDTDERYSDAPMSFMPCWYRKLWDGSFDVRVPSHTEYKYILPILKNTCLSGLIPAEVIWNQLYSYITSLKDVKIEDTRTDVQKAESHGFDKKTSFRHPWK